MEKNKHTMRLQEVTSADELKVMDAIENRYGYSFHGYQMTSWQRRLKLFISRRNIKDVNELINTMINSYDEFIHFINEITVPTTELFRDPELYISFKKYVVPYLESFNSFKIWHAGCSTGEEVYSMGIFLKENHLLNGATLYGTDINKLAIDSAKKAMIHNYEIKKSSQNYFKALGNFNLTHYWNVGSKFSTLENKLLKKMVFSEHNLVSDYGFGEMNVICAKNVLIYFNPKLKNKVLQLFLKNLRTYGYLCLGSKESLIGTDVEDSFEVIDRKSRIYRKKLKGLSRA